MAEKGRGRKVRFQGGTVFPVVMAVVVGTGLGLIGYARATAGSQAKGAQLNSNWHVAFGIYNCDKYIDPVKALATTPPNGVSTQGNGIIYYNPTNSSVSGGKANLSVFLANYGIKVSTTAVTLSQADGGTVLDASTIKCGGKPAELRTVVWNDATKAGSPDLVRNSGDRTNVRITKDNMAIALAIVDPKDASAATPPQPPSVSKLAEINSGVVAAPATTVASGTTAPATSASTTDTTAAPGTTDTTSATATDAPSASVATSAAPPTSAG
jgi:hypothetical protein